MNDFYHFYKDAVSGNHLFEWLTIIVCLLAILAVESIIKKFKTSIKNTLFKYRDKRLVSYFSLRALALSLSIIILFIGGVISFYFSGNYENIIKLIKVTIVLLIDSIVSKKIVKNNLQLKIISILIITPIILSILGLFDLIVKDFSLIGFDVGKNRLSLLLFVKSIYIASILFWIGKYISRVGENSINRQAEWNLNTKIILLKFFNIFLYVILVIVGLNILGFDFTILALFSGAFVLALSLSLQKIASNFLSGIILLFEKAIKVDDFIELQSGIKGKIKYLGARTTIIDALDGSEITVPNEDIINSKIVTYIDTKEHHVQIDVELNIDLDNDPNYVIELLRESALNHPKILSSYDVLCKIEKFYKHNLTYILTFWTLNENKTQVKNEIISNIWKNLTKNNVTFSSE